MRVYKDLDLVEHLRSGVPRILESYPKECFMFSENFLRMSFPAAKTVTPQVTPQVMELVKLMKDEMSRQEIQDKLGLSVRKNFRTNYLNRALEIGSINQYFNFLLVPYISIKLQ